MPLPVALALFCIFSQISSWVELCDVKADSQVQSFGYLSDSCCLIYFVWPVCLFLLKHVVCEVSTFLVVGM